MDGFGLAVFGLPVAAALGLHVIKDYIDENHVTTEDTGHLVDYSTSGTAVDAMTASGTAVDAMTTSGTAVDAMTTTTSGTAVDVQTSSATSVNVLTPSGVGDVLKTSGTSVDVQSFSKTAVDLVTTSETAVDVLSSTSGTAVDNKHVAATEDGRSNDDGYELNYATCLIKNIESSCSYEGSGNSDSAEICERNQVVINDDKTIIDSHRGSPDGDIVLPFDMIESTGVASVGENDYHYESESDDSGNDGSDDEETTSSDMFFSLINCSGAEGTAKPQVNFQNVVISPNQHVPTSSILHVNRCERNSDLLPSTVILTEKEDYPGNVKDSTERAADDTQQVNTLVEAFTQTSDSLHCLHNNNDCTGSKVILCDSFKTQHPDQSGQGTLPGHHTWSTLDTSDNVQSVSQPSLNEQLHLRRSQSISNPLLSFSSGNNRLGANTTKAKQTNNRPIPPEYKTNSTWIPIKPITEREQIVTTTTQYNSESTRELNKTERVTSVVTSHSEASDTVVHDRGSDRHHTTTVLDQGTVTDRFTAVIDHQDADMKIITDSSTQIDIPETPKSPTRQYTVECPVIEPTSPKGKRCMRKMSLEISFVDAPHSPTSPVRDITDFRRQSCPESSESETFKPNSESTDAPDGRSQVATADRRRRQEQIATPPSHHHGRFMYQFAVPRAYIRTVIGEQARVIRRLRQRTGATISVNYPRGFDGCTCTIEGTYSKVLGAVLILRQNFPLMDWSQDEPAEQT